LHFGPKCHFSYEHLVYPVNPITLLNLITPITAITFFTFLSHITPKNIVEYPIPCHLSHGHTALYVFIIDKAHENVTSLAAVKFKDIKHNNIDNFDSFLSHPDFK
jgi:hypothetical protein